MYIYNTSNFYLANAQNILVNGRTKIFLKGQVLTSTSAYFAFSFIALLTVRSVSRYFYPHDDAMKMYLHNWILETHLQQKL